jgi:hypothetical protein
MWRPVMTPRFGKVSLSPRDITVGIPMFSHFQVRCMSPEKGFQCLAQMAISFTSNST